MPSTVHDRDAVTPRVSVIIPTRNASTTIERQLRAVCAQEVDVPFEVVVVDNGSTDETVQVVRRIIDLLSQVRLVDGPIHPSRSAARNVGAERAAGEVLVFCDADDVVESGWLQALVSAAKWQPVVTGALDRVDARTMRSEGLHAGSTRYRGLLCLGSANVAIVRDVFDQVGGFSEAFRHRVDVELTCRLYLDGILVHPEPRAVVRYVRRPDLLAEVRQHFWWSVADVQIMKTYRGWIPLEYSWANSAKHWMLVGPRLVRAAATRADMTPALLTLAALIGRLAGSLRYRTWAI